MPFGITGGQLVDGWNSFWDGGFNKENVWVPGMNVGNMADDTSPMNDASSYAYSQNAGLPPNSVIDYASGDPWHTMESTTTPKTDAEIAAIYAEQRKKADRSRLGVTNEEWRAANPTDNSGRLNITLGGGGGGGRGSSAPSAPVLNTRMPLNRIPSGSVYAPDLSAYNDSSLFNYTGPGGASEYTYGQNLPYQGAGYNIWGSPTDVANPYFWGQFANTAETGAATGPADAAINMPAVEMPAGVPSTNTTTGGGNVGGGTGPGGKDLTYQETLDYFNLNPYAQSTTFPSPGGSNPTLADRQRAQMGADEWDAMVARANAWDKQLEHGGQLGSGFKGEEELNKDVQKTIFDNEYFDTPILGNDTVTSPYVGDAGRGTIVEQRGDRYNAMNPGIDAAIYQYNRDNPTPENFLSTRTQEEIDALNARAANAITAEDLRDGLFGDPTYSIENDAFTLNMTPQKNNANVDSEGNLINRTPPERDFFKLDEINIPTPFKPEGVEGEDYWQSTQGGYYKMADDMGLEPILPPPPLPKIDAFHPPRPSNPADVTGRTAYESPGSRKAYADFMNLPDDSYAKELHLGQIEGESTSNLTAIELADDIEAINAKYEGSTTDASAEAELGELIGAIASSYDREKAILDAGGLSPAMANYLIQDAQNIGELSTRDLIKPSLTYLEDRAGSHSASSDLYAQNERQQRGRGPGLGNTLAANAMDSQLRNQLSNVPVATPSGPPTRQAIPRIEPSIWDRVADSFSRNFSLFGGR